MQLFNKQSKPFWASLGVSFFLLFFRMGTPWKLSNWTAARTAWVTPYTKPDQPLRDIYHFLEKKTIIKNKRKFFFSKTKDDRGYRIVTNYECYDSKIYNTQNVEISNDNLSQHAVFEIKINRCPNTYQMTRFCCVCAIGIKRL